MNSRIAAVLAVVFTVISPTSAYSSKVPCTEGRAGAYPCHSVDLLSEIDLGKSGIVANGGSDVWGWADPVTGREYAIMGLVNKTSFVDITDAENPVHLGDLPTHTYSSIWRDIKVYRDHAYIVSEAWGHGLQVFDLTQLRNVAQAPMRFTETAHYDRFGSAHNIVIDEETGYAYAVGSDTCDAGMHVVDIREPAAPRFSTCVDRSIFDDVLARSKPDARHGEDYTHDAQCVVYRGPDARFQGREVCICSNADTVNIVDMTDKSKPTQIAVKDYTGKGYTHQGWMTEDQRYFLLGDELDEQHNGHNTKTLIWDISDLENPVHLGSFFSTEKAIDHNMYIRDGYVYQANYDAGLRVLSLSDIQRGQLSEAAFFDTEPASNKAVFEGVWSVYPYFPSRNVVVSGINGKLYIVKPTL